jgi:hypothetical protein
LTADDEESRKKWGPRLTRALAPVHRDHPDYWRTRPSDHSAEGLFVGGPAGEHCAIAPLVYFTFCAVSAPTPDGERRAYVVAKARRAERMRADGIDPAPRPRTVWNGGQFMKPAKPANSGRKKKAA